jgi:small subunit ribosomal protein S6
MRRYETIVILDPDLPGDQRAVVFDRLRDLIPAQGGLLVGIDEWGPRKLAYTIRKKPRGYYTRLDYCGEGPLVAEMERLFRIDDRVLKFMTVQLDPEANMENIQQEMTQAAEASRAAASESSEPKAAAAAVTEEKAPEHPESDSPKEEA